ncbi:MAG: aldo/keto reductase [Gammaproteobacteria bacterium]|nr:aldo/keto reductase [Gammaproteobacteria bacterium]
MRYRPLGTSGIDASIVGLGTAAIRPGAADDNGFVKAIRAAIDEGVTLIDTAPSYGWGHSEEVVGKAIEGRRDQVVIATKCGVWWEDERGSYNGVKDGKANRVSLRPDTITIEVENSLRRLGVDTIDLLQCHKPAIPPEETPIPETMGCLMELKDQGKIRAIGVSNVSLEQLDAYREAGDLATDQFRYSMILRDREADILPYCSEHNIATLTYWSLEQGLLTGKVGLDRVFSENDFRNTAGEWLPWFKLENRQRLLDMFAGWADLTEKYGCTIAQLTIAWTAAQTGATHVLCGVRTVDQGIQNAGAGALELDANDGERIRDDLVALGDPV